MGFISKLYESHLAEHVWRLQDQGKHEEAARLLERLAVMERPSGELRYVSECLKAAEEWAVCRATERVLGNARRVLPIILDSHEQGCEYYFGHLCDLVSRLYADGLDAPAEVLANEIDEACMRAGRPQPFARRDESVPEKCPQCGSSLPNILGNAGIVCPHCHCVIRGEGKLAPPKDPPPPPLERPKAPDERVSPFERLVQSLPAKRQKELTELLAVERSRDVERRRAVALHRANDFASAAEVYESMAKKSADNELISMQDSLDAAMEWMAAGDPVKALEDSRKAVARYAASDFFPNPKYDEEMSRAAGSLFQAGYVGAAETMAKEINEEYVKRSLPPRFSAPPGRFPTACPKCGGALPFTFNSESVSCPFCGTVVPAADRTQ